MIEKLGTAAAMALRDATEAAIANMETKAKAPPLKDVSADAAAYFKQQYAEQIAALDELKSVRKALHGRVFDSMK